jgi:hypothetical protein
LPSFLLYKHLKTLTTIIDYVVIGMIFTRKSQKEVQEGKEEKKPSKNPMVEGIAKKAAAATLILGMSVGIQACTMSLEDRTDAGDRDAIVDARDGDVDNDLDMDGDVDQDAGIDGGPDEDLDAGVDAGPDEDLDAGIDAGPDEDLDAGVDAGPDEDLDAGIDAGPDEEPACLGVYNAEELDVTIYDSEPFEIGGYSIALVGAPLNAALVDIKCVSSGADVAIGLRLPVGQETAVEIADDGKRIRIDVHGRTSHYMGADVTVEDL